MVYRFGDIIVRGWHSVWSFRQKGRNKSGDRIISSVALKMSTTSSRRVNHSWHSYVKMKTIIMQIVTIFFEDTLAEWLRRQT